MEPRVAIFSGLGINCDYETRYAFETAGAICDNVHFQDLVEGRQRLNDYQILAIPGGFSYGDDTGAGNALASRIKHRLGDSLLDFVSRDKLVIGICNGSQVLSNLGLVPASDGHYGERKVALVSNDFPRYKDTWVDLDFDNSNSVWLAGLTRASFPIAHGEGKFYTDDATLAEIREKGLVSARYVYGDICRFEGRAPEEANPNGSLEDIAGLSDETGRILGMMPHPERAIKFTHLPNWRNLKAKNRWKVADMPEGALGIEVFRNGVRYFS